MKRAALPLTVAGLACAAVLACHTGVGGHISEDDKDRIRKVVEEGTRLILPPVSDVDAFVTLTYADDARLLPPNLATVTGRAGIASLLRSGGSIRDYRVRILELEGRNDLAYAHGAYEIGVTPPGGREPVGDEGKFVQIWRKQRDGGWKVALEIFSSDLPQVSSPATTSASPAPASPAPPGRE